MYTMLRRSRFKPRKDCVAILGKLSSHGVAIGFIGVIGNIGRLEELGKIPNFLKFSIFIKITKTKTARSENLLIIFEKLKYKDPLLYTLCNHGLWKGLFFFNLCATDNFSVIINKIFVGTHCGGKETALMI